MDGIQFVHRCADPRILIISQRLMMPYKSMGLMYEFEDLIATIDRADIVAPKDGMLHGKWLRGLARRLDRFSVLSQILLPRMSFETANYDLAFVGCQTLGGVHNLIPVSNVCRLARMCVCFVEEMWESEVTQSYTCDLLSHFDYVFVACAATVSALETAAISPCGFLPPAINGLRFCKPHDAPGRRIDVFWMGRRLSSGHQQLLQWASNTKRLYLYDTTGNAVVAYPEHRVFLANLIRHARFFVVNPAKVDVPSETKGQEEVGFRYFEGAAGGAVMIGRAPDSEVFRTLFPWPDAVLSVAIASDGLGDALEALEAQPDRLEQASRRNMAESLRRHDGVYRWRQVLETVGLSIPEKLLEREAQLLSLAKSIDDGMPWSKLDSPVSSQ